MQLKLIGCLSTIAVYCFGAGSVAAIEIPEQFSQSTYTIASNPLRGLEREQRVLQSQLQRAQRKREREQRAEFRRQQRELRRLKRQQELERLEQRQKELEAARQAATEEQQLEAERRRQYFESLSPEDKKAYLAEQEARRIQANDRAAALFGLMSMFLLGGSGSSSEGGSYHRYQCQDRNDVFDYEIVELSEAEASRRGGCVKL